MSKNIKAEIKRQIKELEKTAEYLDSKNKKAASFARYFAAAELNKLLEKIDEENSNE